MKRHVTQKAPYLFSARLYDLRQLKQLAEEGLGGKWSLETGYLGTTTRLYSPDASGKYTTTYLYVISEELDQWLTLSWPKRQGINRRGLSLWEIVRNLERNGQ